MRKVLLLLLPVLGVSVSVHAQALRLKPRDLRELQGRMTGHFSSAEQARRDTAFLHIELRMARIWPQRTDGYWLYVEQAAASSPDKPYRQRIYRLNQVNDTTAESKVYEIANPLRFAGAWGNKGMLDGLTPDSLIDRQGCAIYLHKSKDGNFYGSTPGKECLSTLRGASYATSEAAIYKDRMETWDRGWNANGKQVWGAVKGGYIFDKIK